MILTYCQHFLYTSRVPPCLSKYKAFTCSSFTFYFAQAPFIWNKSEWITWYFHRWMQGYFLIYEADKPVSLFDYFSEILNYKLKHSFNPFFSLFSYNIFICLNSNLQTWDSFLFEVSVQNMICTFMVEIILNHFLSLK